MAACYTKCMTMQGTAACPSFLDIPCVCANFPAFDKLGSCVQSECDTGIIGTAAWGMVQSMCAPFGGQPQAGIAPGVNYQPSAAGLKGSKTYATSVVVPYGGARAPGYTDSPAKLPVGGSAAPSSLTGPGRYAALKATSGTASNHNVKTFGVAGLLSLGFGALMIVGVAI